MKKFLCKFIFLGSKIFFILLFVKTSMLYAAVGCTLNDPDRDIKKLFPQATGYKTDFITIKEKGGQYLFEKIQKELGDTLDPVYETIDVPYAFYDVLEGKDVIAHIHGINQKGTYGGMQLIIATDLNEKIIAFYYQKMSSPEAEKFMDKNFTNQFLNLSLENLLKNNFFITDPSKNSKEDFYATLRGIKKNLILLHELKIKKHVI